MTIKKKRIARLLLVLGITALITVTNIPAVFASSSAANITSHCSFAPSSNSDTFKNALDGIYSTVWCSARTSTRTIDFTVASGYNAGGIYVVWSSAPAKWELLACAGDGSSTSVAEGSQEQYLTQYINIPSDYADYSKFRLVMTPANSGSAVDIADIAVYSPGSPPYYAPEWEPITGRADLLTIASHPDDEDLYLSVPAVTYANQGMKCATAFMTYGSASTSVRRYEAQESVWSLGNKWYPDMGNFVDEKTTSLEAQEQYWPLDSVVGYIVEKIRKYKPSVIVTHGIRGEYGHGGHMLTEYASTLAFQYSGDPGRYPDSAAKYGTWRAGKLYVHQYGTNALNTMSLTSTLNAFGGRSVLQVIQDAYSRQKSQLPGRSLPTSGDYDMRQFGMFASNLGADSQHASMFEHVSQDAMLALNPWYNSVVVDRSALQDALDTANAKDKANYTPESWAAAGLPGLISTAQGVMDNRESTQAQVDAQTKKLNDAVVKLVPFLTELQIPDPPDKQAYLTGESLDLTGLTVAALYSDGSRKALTADKFVLSGFDSTAPVAQQAVTITYSDGGVDKSAAFYVDILPADGEKIASTVYTIDKDNRLLLEVSAGTSVSQLIANLTNTPENLKVYNRDGSEYTGDKVATGMILKLTVDGTVTDTLKLSVFGDVSGDGVIDIDDVILVRAYILKKYSLRPMQLPAADISKDGVVDIDDVIYMRANILGKHDIHAK